MQNSFLPKGAIKIFKSQENHAFPIRALGFKSIQQGNPRNMLLKYYAELIRKKMNSAQNNSLHHDLSSLHP